MTQSPPQYSLGKSNPRGVQRLYVNPTSSDASPYVCITVRLQHQASYTSRSSLKYSKHMQNLRLLLHFENAPCESTYVLVILTKIGLWTFAVVRISTLYVRTIFKLHSTINKRMIKC